MESPVYQDLSWNTFPQQCKQKDYKSQLEQKRNTILQSLQQSPPNRVDLERQLHQVQTEIYMLQNNSSYDRHQVHSETPPVETDVMDTLTLPQSGTSWTKQFIDSGIASGSTTSPPSDDGGNQDYQADIDDELAMHNIPSFEWEIPYNKTAYSGNQSRSQRLRAELFPDATEDTSYNVQYNNSPVTPTPPAQPPAQPPSQPPSHQPAQPPVLQTLGESTNMAQTAIEHIVRYQDDSELAMHAIPEFSKLLHEKNSEILIPVTTCLHQLSKKEASMHAMLSYPQLVAAIIRTLTTSTDTEVIRCCVGTLHNLSYLREGLEAIHKFRGIPILCDLLNNHNEHILYYTITTLHNLIQRHAPSIPNICLSGGLEKMVSLLKYIDKPQFVAMVADCIHLLCHRNPDKKLIVAACDGPSELVKVLQSSSLEYLVWATSRALKTLSVCSRNKKDIIEAGGMHALSRHLDTGSQRVTEEILYTMRNLSNVVTKIENLDPIITKLMDVLSRTNITFIACSVGCLSNLTCNNPNNKKIIFRSGGMDTLLRCLLHNHNIPSVAEPILCTLRHINYKHSEYEQTQHAFRSTGGINLISKVLSTAQHWAVIKATCGLIRNLALNSSNMSFFKDTGILVHLLQCSLRVTEHHKNGFSEIRDGIRLEDILCESLKTLQTVSYNSEMTNQLTNPLMVHFVMKCLCLHSNNEVLLESALSIMVQLGNNESFMLMVKKDPRCELFGQLCHCRNPRIAQLAGVVNSKLGELQLEHTPNVFPTETGILPWSPNNNNNNAVTPGIADVVDLDATTAQYRDKTISQMSPGMVGPYSPHYNSGVQRSPHLPSSPYQTAFPTTYPHVTNAFNNTQTIVSPSYHQAGYPPASYANGYTPNQTILNRNWYAM